MVSIIIPVYCVVSYIEDCLRSVINQTYSDFELILIDDCGKDGSVEIAERVLSQEYTDEKYEIVRHNKNRGLSAARNTGLSVAKGEYVFFLDSDDTISPDCLELLVKKAEESRADVTIGNINVVGDASYIPKLNILNSNYISKYGILDSNETVLLSYFHQEYYVMAWNKLIRKSFLLDNEIYFVEGLVHEDNPWTFHVSCAAQKIAFVEAETYNYLVRDNSLQTSKNFDNHFKAYSIILKEYEMLINKYSYCMSNLCKFELQCWIEKQKALFFSLTKDKGTNKQLHQMYSIIRNCMPNGEFNKVGVHYFLPRPIGFLLYRHFYGYQLM